jgi:hypothetical protein
MINVIHEFVVRIEANSLNLHVHNNRILKGETINKELAVLLRITVHRLMYFGSS